MLSVGQLIKIGRINKDLSQDDVASELEVTKNYISLVENNKKNPSITFLRRISKLLEIPVILLIWEKIDLPKGKTEPEKKITFQLEKMLGAAQQSFAQRALGVKK